MKKPTASNDSPNLSLGNLLNLGEGILTFLVFFTMGADPAPHRNEAHYLTRLKHFWDPQWCQGDLFLDSPDAHFTVVWLLGWLTLFLSLEVVAWIGRLICWVLLAWAWQRLHERIVPINWLAPLTAALFVVATEQCHLAGEWIIGGFEAKTLAYGFVVLAISDAIDGRWNRCWILLGVASAMHALVGAWSVFALFLAWLFASRSETKRFASLSDMAPGLLIGASLSMLGVWPALALNFETDPEIVSKANEVYVYTRLPHHLSLLSMAPSWLMNRVLRHLLIVALLIATGKLLNQQPQDAYKSNDEESTDQNELLGLQLIRRFAWASLGISAIGFSIDAFGYFQPNLAASLLKYYWWRLADIAVPLAVSLSFAYWLKQALSVRQPKGIFALFASLAIVVWGVGGYSVQKLDGAQSPADGVLRDPEDWVAMCEWIEENTPENSRFLVPRSSHSFKWHTGRPEVITYKDVPQDAKTMLEWNRRFHEVYQIGTWEDGSKRWARSLSHLGANRLLELGDNYEADFALSQDILNRYGQSKRRAFGLAILHQVGRYTLYDLRTLTKPPTP